MKNFFKQKKGSITIEASVLFGLFVLLIMVIADVGSVLLMKQRLDRLAYSLASIVRERTVLYNNEPLDELQADEIYTMTRNLTKSMFRDADNLSIKIESIEFDKSNKTTAIPTNTKAYARGNMVCAQGTDINTLSEAAIYTPVSQWSPMYRVSVCAKPTSNFYMKTNVATNLVDMTSAAVVYAR
ncbi:tight adherence pilus pseudopilin TadF [Helicobacter sp. 11S02629-2]|uniref:tight adherence pilus pseudopilin TadF n=1 Tax=Helicobacter sp. 11S02629-2 TaxID=1476195 RepID=UPI000BA78537|nr:tight adherence pilus pseudopilin TadF [Helicobacter sp. 11S02629-2]PAF45747.1 hypothetical protein BKH40_02405 [Helicobacter sp. 11S02629-2]